MKHTNAKLTLRTETVRHLTSEQLSRAGGGQQHPTGTEVDQTGVTQSRTAGRVGGSVVTNDYTSSGLCI